MWYDAKETTLHEQIKTYPLKSHLYFVNYNDCSICYCAVDNSDLYKKKQPKDLAVTLVSARLQGPTKGPKPWKVWYDIFQG